MASPKRSSPRERPSRSSSDITLNPVAAAAIERGHPWLWRQGIVRGGQGLTEGAIVRLRDVSGSLLGEGLWDPSSPIAARVFTRGAGERLDVDLIAKRIERAILRRDAFIDEDSTDAYRLCNGEGDKVPGFVMDRYGETAVVRLDGSFLRGMLAPIAERIFPSLKSRNIQSVVRRLARDEAPKSGDSKIELLLGPPPKDTVTVRENGVRMIVDLARGQKTGAFLDQRDNRARVRRFAEGKRVLNLFSYAGGFSTAAALGGASHVTSVDIAHAAHATAQATMRANGVDPSAHAFVTADAFTFLESAEKRGDRWDLVISDPPSFAPSEKARSRALTAYRRLHAACAKVLSTDGIFCAASCSSHISPETFLGTLDDASLGRSDLSLLALHGPGLDHPIVPAFPEGRYLKFAVLR